MRRKMLSVPETEEQGQRLDTQRLDIETMHTGMDEHCATLNQPVSLSMGVGHSATERRKEGK